MLEKTSGQNPVANPTIVDTDILIDAGRGISDAVTCLQNLKSSSSLAISIVTQMELIVGCANTEADYCEVTLRVIKYVQDRKKT